MTSSNFRFLRRVRIHGEECDAVARALHRKLKGMFSLEVADLEMVSKSTYERTN